MGRWNCGQNPQWFYSDHIKIWYEVISPHTFFYLPLLLRTCTLSFALASLQNYRQECLLSKLLRKAEKQSRYMGVVTRKQSRPSPQTCLTIEDSTMNININANNTNAIYKMKKLVKGQKEALHQEKGLATFYGAPCPEYITLKEKSLEDIERKLNDMLSDMADWWLGMRWYHLMPFLFVITFTHLYSQSWQ